MRATTPTRFGDLDAVRERHDAELVDRLVESVFETDADADALVKVFEQMKGGEGWRLLERGLSDGIDAVPDAPDELVRVLADALAPPDWVDFDLVDRGAVAWWRTGSLLQLLALTAGSLAYGYGTSFSRPLLQTGRLAQRAPRRLSETATWVVLSTRPGALRPGGAGVAETVHIRMVHALVRRQIKRKGGWDTANWGEPISVGDTLATGIIGFFAYPTAGLQDLGVEYSGDELEAMTHLWAWITYLMGVPKRLLPSSYDEAVRIWRAGSDLDQVKIDGADDLLDSLFFHSLHYERLLPGPLIAPVRGTVGRTMAAFARRWMGPERADRLDIPRTRVAAVIPLVRAAVGARERARSLGLMPSDERMVALEFAAAGAISKLTRPALPLRPDALAGGS